VLLALLVQPRHPKARLVVLTALIEYAVTAFFGVFFGLLVGLINLAADAGARAAFMGLLVRLGWLAVLAVAGYAVFLIWQRLYTAPKPPRPAPGVYGQQPPFNPGVFPGQPGFGPPPPGHPGPPPPPGGFGPTTYGQPTPQSAPPFPGAPPFQGPPQGMPPHSAPPFHGPPQGMPPQSAPPFQGAPTYPDATPAPSWNQPAVPLQPHGSPAAPPFSEPTQVVPQQPADDRTDKLDEPRPGFGPAEPDPPRS
jgi:hypothetical protein